MLLLLLLGYLVMVADSCPMVDTVDPSSGSTDSSFTYTLAGGDFGSNISLTSTAGLLNYTVLSDSLIRFSFQQGSSARGSVYVTVEPSAIGCSAVNITVFITVPCENEITHRNTVEPLNNGNIGALCLVL